MSLKDFTRPSSPANMMLIYGGGGIGKSTRVAEAIEYFWRLFGVRSRVVGADGGGTTNAIQVLLDAGIADYWPIDQWDGSSIFTTLDMATQGWWPSDTATPNSHLLPAVREWKPCTFCGGDSGAKALTMVPACAACKKPFAPGQILPLQRDPINGFEKIGLMAFEGFTSFGDLLLRRLKYINPEGGNMLKDGDFRIANPGQSHYGSAQSYLGQFVTNCRRLPVPVVIWTALENRGDDEGKPLYGPKGPGKALTTACIPWFTDVLHLDAVAKRKGGVVEKDADGFEILERRLYLAPHFPADAPQYRFAAKTSVPFSGGMPLVMEPSMAKFFAARESAMEKARELLLKEEA